MDDNVNSGQNMDLQGDNDNDIYIIDSSDMTEYDKMIAAEKNAALPKRYNDRKYEKRVIMV